MSVSSPDGEFERAMALHREGRVDEAMAIYQSIVERFPDHSGAIHLIGVCLSTKGQPILAVKFIEAAILLNGGEAAYHLNLGNVLMTTGAADRAEKAYADALGLKFDLPEAWFGQGNARMVLGRPAEAADAFEQALRLRTPFPEAHANLGRAAMALGDWNRAIGALDQAIGGRPDDENLRLLLADALARVGRFDEAGGVYFSLAELPRVSPNVLFQGANWLSQAKWFDPAIQMYRKALDILPDEVALWNNMGNALRELGRWDEAKAAFEQALKFVPDDSGILSNLSTVAKDRGDLVEAIRLGELSLQSSSDPLCFSNLGLAYYLSGDIDKAQSLFDRAADLSPNDPDILFHQSLVDLINGRFESGWKRYEARWNRRRATEFRRHADAPQWQGEDLAGRTILIWSEQGLGDTLQFIRFARQIAARGGRVVAEVQASLVTLVSAMPDISLAVAVGGDLPAFDLQIPLMSLPYALRLAEQDLTDFTPYLAAPPSRSGKFERADGRPRIGVVWAGESRKNDVECVLTDRRRSIDLALLSDVLAIPDVDFVSLQLGPPRDQGRGKLIDPMDAVSDFADTAALMETLDAVIAVDTSVLHLAGAMGKKLFVLSRFDGCWRWMRNRDQSPWYPSLTLYRQTSPGDWDEPVARLKEDVVDWLQAR